MPNFMSENNFQPILSFWINDYFSSVASALDRHEILTMLIERHGKCVEDYIKTKFPDFTAKRTPRQNLVQKPPRPKYMTPDDIAAATNLNTKIVLSVAMGNSVEVTRYSGGTIKEIDPISFTNALRSAGYSAQAGNLETALKETRITSPYKKT